MEKLGKKGSGTVTMVMGIVIVLVIVVSVAVPIITSQNVSGLSTEAQTVYGLLPLLLIVGAGVMLVVRAFF